MVYYCKYWWYRYKIAIVAKSFEDQLTLSNIFNKETFRIQISFPSSIKLKAKLHLFSPKKKKKKVSISLSKNTSVRARAVYPTKAYNLIIYVVFLLTHWNQFISMGRAHLPKRNTFSHARSK